MCKTLVAFCAASFLEIFVSIIRLFTEVMPLKDNGKGSGSDDALSLWIGKPVGRFTGFKPVTGLQNVFPVTEFF